MTGNHSSQEEAPGKSPQLNETNVELMTSSNHDADEIRSDSENRNPAPPSSRLDRADSSAEEKKESSAEKSSDNDVDLKTSQHTEDEVAENTATIGASNVSQSLQQPATGDGGAALRDIFSNPGDIRNATRSSASSSPIAGTTAAIEHGEHSVKPDPPPSVVDYEEVREELGEDEKIDDKEVLGRDVYMIDENRLGQQILQAALALNNNGATNNNNNNNNMVSDNNGMTVPGSIPETEKVMHNERESVSQIPGAPNVAVLAANQTAVLPVLRNLTSSEDAVDASAPQMNGGGAYPQSISLPMENAMAAQQVMRPPIVPLLTPQSSFHGQQPQQQPVTMMMGNGIVGGRRKIRLRMEEETMPSSWEGGVDSDESSRGGFLRSIRRSALFGSGELPTPMNSAEQVSNTKFVPRGILTISWFEGTSSAELREHVKRSVIRKLKLPKYIRLTDFRVLDEGSDPPEEIVLCPFIPDGSQFLLRFSTKDISKESPENDEIRAPESPSAAPSPHPKKGIHGGLDSEELAKLQQQLDALRPQSSLKSTEKIKKNDKAHSGKEGDGAAKEGEKHITSIESKKESTSYDEGSDEDEMVLHSEDPIESQLRQITELLLMDRDHAKEDKVPQHARRQVVFTLANYFVLFLSFIAISAEIQARAPGWIASLEKEMKNVADCSENQEALFECISRGDFAGLVASVLLWFSRSVDTRKLFLLGFDSPHKLWTVVYESFVTAFCWGLSYLFIRRGLNPDTRTRFVQKYWKDAVYGSLAGFNAAFMKQVLKNFIPQEAVENAMKTQQLKILSWLPHFQE